jgi:hypothetical protein
LKSRSQKAEKPWNQYRQLVLTAKLDPFSPVKLKYQVRKLREKLRKPAEGISILYEPSFEHVDVVELLMRGVGRIPPSSAAGEELRDVAIWFIVLGHAKNSGVPVAFITDDSGYWEGDKPKEQIARDISKSDVKVSLFRSIDEFLRANAPKPQPASADWASHRISLESIIPELLSSYKTSITSRLAWQVVGSPHIDRIEFVEGRFSGGTRYDLGEGVEFAEVTYHVTLLAEIQVLPSPQPQYALLPSTGMLSLGYMQGLGFSRSGPGIVPPPEESRNWYAQFSKSRGSTEVSPPPKQKFLVTGDVGISVRVDEGHAAEIQLNNFSVLDTRPVAAAEAVPKR